MSLFHDIKFVNLLASQLPRFKRKSEYLWNTRCPICLDSQKNKHKARGYIYRKKNDLFYKCHNCGIGLSLGNFIKFVSPSLYNTYVFERYQNGESKKAHSTPRFEEYKPKKIQVNLNLPNIIELRESHPAHEYLIKRQIPLEHLSLFYYAEDFQQWALEITKGEYKSKYHTEDSDPRIVIPFLDRTGKLVAVQGRSLLPSHLRYVTLKFDEESPKIFGLERWKPNEKTWITEGPFDSLFLPNALAMAGTTVDITSIVENKANIVYVFDNERRSKDIVHLMLKVAKAGYKVALWNETNAYKDINEMVLGGRTPESILSEIEDNTKFGLEAILQINCWKKCE